MGATEVQTARRSPNRRGCGRTPKTIAGIAVSVGMVLTIGACGDDSSDAGSPASGSTSATSTASTTTTTAVLPTATAAQLVLPEADFPPLAGGTFSLETGPDDDDSDITVDNPECQDFVKNNDRDEPGVDRAERKIEADISGGGDQSYTAGVKKSIDLDYTDNFARILATCAAFGVTIRDDGKDIPARVTMERITLPGITSPYNAVRMVVTVVQGTTTVSVVNQLLLGVERGTSFKAGYGLTSTTGPTVGPDVNTNLVRMFVAQRARIAAAQ